MFAWIILTDFGLSEHFWPDDLHERIVKVLGGSVQRRAAGRPEVWLSWWSVLIRVVCVMIVLAVTGTCLRSWTEWKRAKAAGPQETVSAPVTALDVLVGGSWIPALGLSSGWLMFWFLLPVLGSEEARFWMLRSTPLWAAMVAAALANGPWLPAGARKPVEAKAAGDSSDTTAPGFPAAWIALLIAAAVWTAVAFWMNHRLYAGLLVPHGDSAMYEEHLWNVWHGKGFRSYLDQGLFLGEHVQVIHLLLLPLHMLWPSYLLMELVANLALAACVIPVFRMAVWYCRCPRAGMWLGLAWLAFFPMHYLDIAIDLKTLRPSCYGLPFLFWGIDCAVRGWRGRALVCLLVALTTQEDFALVTGSLGVVFWFVGAEPSSTPALTKRRHRLWASAVCVMSVAWLLLAVLVVIPGFRGGQSVHYARYFGDLGSTPGELLNTLLREPSRVLVVLVSWRTLFYLLVLTVPLGLTPWRRPLLLCAGAATFVMLSLIQLGNSAEGGASGGYSLAEPPPVPYHHFHAPLLPVLFWAAAAALGRQENTDRRPSVRGTWQPVDSARFACACAVFTAVSGSMMPCGAVFWSAESSRGWSHLSSQQDRAAEWERIRPLLPLTARIASTDFLHTRLTHAERSYDYSDYLRAVNNYQPGVPADTEYIAIDTTHPYSRIRSLTDVPELQRQPEAWEVLSGRQDGEFIVLRRRVTRASGH